MAELEHCLLFLNEYEIKSCVKSNTWANLRFCDILNYMNRTLTYLVRVIISILLISNMGAVSAGYENTQWGMSPKKISSLYPGGFSVKEGREVTSYRVIRSVANYSTAYLEFEFTKKTGLKSLAILFPQQGTKIDLKRGSFTEMTSENGLIVFNDVTKKLTWKYGKPFSANNGSIGWNPEKDELIMLSILPSMVASGHSTVGIIYSKAPSVLDMTNGL